MVTSLLLIYKTLFLSSPTFETPPKHSEEFSDRLLPFRCCHRLQRDVHLDSPKLIQVEVVAHLVASEKEKENCHG